MATTSTKSRSGAGRTLIFFFISVAVLYGLMAAIGQWTPRLGLDLRGGTTITLTASNTSGSGGVTPQSLEQARQIIQQRVDGLGVGEAAVTTQGNNNIVVSAPNTNRDELVQQVGTTALLSFRNVYQVAGAAPAPSATPSGTPAPSAAPSASASAAPSAGPASPSASASRRVQPGLPTAPPTPRPTAPSTTRPTFEQALAWQPSQQDLADFAAYQCNDPFPDVSDQPLVTCDESGTAKYLLGPELIAGSEVVDATAGIPQGQLSWVVTLAFDKGVPKGSTEKITSSDKFLKVTEFLMTQTEPQNQFAIVLDSKVMSAPRVSERIPNGEALISGSFTQASSQQLANVLKYGALPLKFEASSIENVSPTLGGEQLRGGLIAGLIGLVLVVLYSMFYYQGLSIVVVGSLLCAAAITYPMMVLLGEAVGFALNLPGIAGAVIAIGTTADSFIIYFERIRDEIRDGRSLRTAIVTGWQKARGTVVVADCVSLLSATVLFVLAMGGVRGFAFTLGLTTLIDIYIVFFFTYPLMVLLGRTRFYGEGTRWSGLAAEHMGVSRASLLGRRSPANKTAREKKRRPLATEGTQA